MPILEYHRPQTLEAALALLTRTGRLTVPLGGGTWLNSPAYQRAHFTDHIGVVDLQALGLNTLAQDGTFIEIGATLTLQSLLDAPGGPGVAGLPEALTKAARLEAPLNLRQVSTVAGALVAADGRSPFCTAMLALDARLTIMPGEAPAGDQVHLGDLLPAREERLRQRLITRITLPAAARLAYEYVARTPADRPVACAAVARWPSGRTRVCLGGYGPAPVLAMDGPEQDGAEVAARAAYSQAGDEWASAEYRAEMAAVLTNRCLTKLHSPGG